MNTTLMLALLTVISLSSCTALRGDYGKPLTQDEDRRLRASDLTGAERKYFFLERELTPEQRAILNDGPPIYADTDYGSVKVGGSYINMDSVRAVHAQQAEALGRALSQQQ